MGSTTEKIVREARRPASCPCYSGPMSPGRDGYWVRPLVKAEGTEITKGQ